MGGDCFSVSYFAIESTKCLFIHCCFLGTPILLQTLMGMNVLKRFQNKITLIFFDTRTGTPKMLIVHKFDALKLPNDIFQKGVVLFQSPSKTGESSNTVHYQHYVNMYMLSLPQAIISRPQVVKVHKSFVTSP